MTKTTILTGDRNIPALPMTDAQVNHLRRLLAWMGCEYMLDDDRQRGFLLAMVKCGETSAATGQKASEVLQAQADKINQVPAYVRQAHKMLSKAVREHDLNSGVVDESKPTENLQTDHKAAGAASAKKMTNLRKEQRI